MLHISERFFSLLLTATSYFTLIYVHFNFILVCVSFTLCINLSISSTFLKFYWFGKVFSSDVRFGIILVFFIFRNILLNFFSLCFFEMSGFSPLSPLLPSLPIFNFITVSLVIVCHCAHLSQYYWLYSPSLFSHSPFFSPLATISVIYLYESVFVWFVHLFF